MTDFEKGVLETKKFVDDTAKQTVNFLDDLIYEKFPDSGYKRWLIHGRVINMLFSRFFKISIDATKDIENMPEEKKKD